MKEPSKKKLYVVVDVLSVLVGKSLAPNLRLLQLLSPGRCERCVEVAELSAPGLPQSRLLEPVKKIWPHHLEFGDERPNYNRTRQM